MRRPRRLNNPTSMQIRLESEMYDKLLALSEARGISMSTLARWALTQYLQKEQQNATQ